MTENQFTQETENQESQALEDNLSDNQKLPENYQEEDSINIDKDSGKDLTDQTRQHDYKNPSDDQFEIDEEGIDEDELNSDAEAFDQVYEDNTNLLNAQGIEVE